MTVILTMSYNGDNDDIIDNMAMIIESRSIDHDPDRNHDDNLNDSHGKEDLILFREPKKFCRSLATRMTGLSRQV